MEYYEVIAILTSLALSAFFSGTEIAFVSANRLYFELQKKQGVLSGRIISDFFKQPSRFIATMLVGNTVTLVLYGIYMANILDPIVMAYLPSQINNELSVLVVQSVISTLIVLITAEFLPKTLFMLNPDRLLEIFSIPILIAYWLLFIFVYVVVGLSKFVITKILGLAYTETTPIYSLVDLHNYITNTQTPQDTPSTNPEIDSKIFAKAILFRSVKVRDCMIPRTEIFAVEVDDDIAKLKQAFLDSGHSKVIVYQESIDEVIGYCHALDLFKSPKDIRSILSDIIIIPASTPAQEILARFISEHKSLALVIDEFGGTEGIVSIEDVVEEIFGEIQDEYDQEDWVEQKINESTYIFSARHEIDELNDRYDWQIPEGEYDTLGGFILSNYENIPQVNEVIKIPPFTFTVLSMQYSRIDTIKMLISQEYLEQVQEKNN